jgi:hypothetical protein
MKNQFASRRCKPSGNAIKESSFQARVIVAAKMNGWRIDYGHTQESSKSRIHHWLSHFFRGKIEKVQTYLRDRRQDLFTLAYHTYDSRYSQPGFPDLVLVHPDKPKIIFAELKSQTGTLRTEQKLWLAALSCVASDCDNVLVKVWRPSDWETDIVPTLGGIDPKLFL